MTTAQATREWLAAGLRPHRRTLGASLFLVILASFLLAVSAKIQFPIGPVPFTMQSLMVLLIGLAYGSRLGTAALLADLAEGAAGLPVFAGPAAGIAYFAGPSAGFLIGFVLAAGLVGWLAEHGYDPQFGARPMARLVDQSIKKKLAESILFGDLREGGVALVKVQGDALVLDPVPAPVATA